jgi:hypothetical protein
MLTGFDGALSRHPLPWVRVRELGVNEMLDDGLTVDVPADLRFDVAIAPGEAFVLSKMLRP